MEQHKSNLPEAAWRYIAYLSFKMECAEEQEQTMVRFTKDKAQEHFNTLQNAQELKVVELAKNMPKNALTRKVTKPKVMYKNDGSLSSHGTKWLSLLKEQKLSEDTVGPITIVTSYEDGNPNSPIQVKDWLYSLGWKPCTFQFKRNKKTGEERQIPQIRYLKGHDREGELCDSVLRLAKKDPAVEILDGLTIITHRLGFFKSMLESCVEKDGEWWLKAEVAGLTNTLRFKHSKPLANLPSVDKPWGKEIRSCLIAASDDETLCGWDMVSLESNTKRHFMYPHDPAYVAEMSEEGFDEHLDLAKNAGAVTQEEIEAYSRGERPDIKAIRSVFKPANYAGIYGIGAAGLARQTGFSVKRCGELLAAYWERNWSVKKVAEEQYVKKLKDGSMWLYNPVSGFFYSLRYDKDRFSTLNQSTGVYVFDKNIGIMRKAGIKFCMQFHDEGAFSLKKGTEDMNDEKLNRCVVELNEALQLHIPMGIDAKYGGSYADIH